MHIFNISRRVAVAFTVLFLVFYVLINFSGIGVNGLLEITGGPSILDFEQGYTAREAYDMLTALGAEGRAFYLSHIVPLDFPFPLSYALCYAGWIAVLLQRTFTGKGARWLLAVPLLAMLCDWTENVGITAMLRGYPDLPAWAVQTASAAGVLKMACTVASIAVIAILLVVWFVRRGRKA